jgi:cyclophilin family peptidyl-prolyl cis-trans isomerase
MNLRLPLPLALVPFLIALPAAAQTSLPTLSRPIPDQILNRGAVQINLATHFGVPGVIGQVVQFNFAGFGRVNVELQPGEAPNNVANFLNYVGRNAYDGTILHRIDNLGTTVPALVQGGGFAAVVNLSSIERAAPVSLEARLPLVRGTLAAARPASDPNGATSEWFFNTIDNSLNLQGGYSVIGRVLGSGMSVIDTLAQTQTITGPTAELAKLPVRGFTPTAAQPSPSLANLLTLSTARVIPVYPQAVGDPTAVLSFRISSPFLPAPPNQSSQTVSGIVATSLTGSTLTITPLAVGSVFLEVSAVDSNGNSSLITRFQITIPPESILAPVFTAHPVSQTVAIGGSAILHAPATGGAADIFPLTYQWVKNGVPINAPSSPFLVLRNLAAGDAGTYACRVSNSLGTSVSLPATLSTVATPANGRGRLVNLAVRTDADDFFEPLIVGFAIGDARTAGTKPLLVRGVGPSLAALAVPNVMADPVLKMFRDSLQVAQNDNWLGDPLIGTRSAQVGAFALTGNDSLDAAVALTSPSGSYTIQITNKVEGRGNVLAEVYDATPAAEITESTPRLINVSARAKVGDGRSTLIAGFVVAGNTPATVLVRAVGPALAAFGVDDAAGDPKLEMYRGTTFLAENNDWNGDRQVAALAASVGAFPLPANGSKDAVLLLTLPPGTYTAQTTDTDRLGGSALLEVYEIR